MQATASSQPVTEERYFEAEERAAEKHEFYRGQIFAMAGRTPQHAIIAVNLASELRSRLKGRTCRAYSSDLRVKVEESGFITYPDVTIGCGEQRFDQRGLALLNPSLVAEILSDSTEKHDRSFKFHHYQRIPSLETFLLVAQDAPIVEQYIRQSGNQWQYQIVLGLNAILELVKLGISLPMAEIYSGVAFPTEPTSSTSAQRS